MARLRQVELASGWWRHPGGVGNAPAFMRPAAIVLRVLCRPTSSLGEQQPPRALCIAAGVLVPVHSLRALPLLAAQHEAQLLDELRAFWRCRGAVLPLLVECGMLLDAAELFRLVALRGGFWSACAAQVCLEPSG